MKYTDAEFKQLPNIIYYTGHWSYGELLSNAEIPYQIRTYIISYDDDDLNMIYTEEIDNLLKIYNLLKNNCCKPQHTLFIKLDGNITQKLPRRKSK